MKKKILIITPGLNLQGGVSSYWNSILPELRNKKNISIENLEVGGHGRKFIGRIYDQLRAYRLLSQNYDLVVLNPSLGVKSFFRDSFFASQLVMRNTPFIIFFRGWNIIFEKKVSQWFRKIFLYTYGKANTIIVLSKDFENKIREWGYKGEILVETTTVDSKLLINYSFRDRVKNVNGSNSIKILFLSRILKGKGVFETVDAFRQLKKRFVNLELIIAGGGEDFELLKKYVREDVGIVLKGHVEGEDKISLLSDCHIHCLPSYSEGLPNSVLESMAFGMPVITTSVGGLKHFFKDGLMGYFVEVKSVLEIKNKIEYLLNDRSKMIAMGEYNYNLANRSLTNNVVVERIYNYFSAILNTKKALIITPTLTLKGGVSAYWNIIFPILIRLDEFTVENFEVGGHGKNFFGRFSDQFNFFIVLNKKFDLAVLNPSLGVKSFFRDSFFAIQMARKRTPFMVFFHGWDLKFEKRVTKRFQKYFLYSYGKAASIIVLSKDFKDKIREWGYEGDVLIETTTVDGNLLGNYSIDDRIENVNKSSTIKILFLSRIIKEKGVFETIDAFRILNKKHSNIELLIAGNGRDFDLVENYIEKDLNISMTGYVEGDDKSSLLKKCHIYCLPSYSEGLPLSILEAMAFGMPVITTKVGGLKYFFKNSLMGYFVEKKSVNEIVDKIDFFLKSNDEIIKVGKYNFKYYEKYLLDSIVANRLYNAIDKNMH